MPFKKLSMDFEKRARAGIIASAAGIAVNFALAAVKIFFGITAGIVSLAADGFNNFTDCGGSAASMISFKISAKPADKEHPTGHRRAEYIASMVIGFFVLFVAWELLRESFFKAAGGETVVPGIAVFVILSVSVVIKAGMCAFYRVMSSKLQSEALAAASVDSFCDCISSVVVTAGAFLSKYLGFPADGWAGIFVAVMIAVQGIFVLKRAGSELLGEAPDPELIKSMRSELLRGNNVLGIHDLHVYCFGKDAYVATVHVEMSASVSPLEAHAEIDRLEHSLSSLYGVSVTAHLDPVDLTDGEALELEKRAKEAVKDMADGLELHDFRLVRGVENKLIFDAGIPFSCPHTDGEMKEKITSAVREACNLEPVVTVERE